LPYGAIAHYECEDGYELVAGDDHRECVSNGGSITGFWTGIELVCGRMLTIIAHL